MTWRNSSTYFIVPIRLLFFNYLLSMSRAIFFLLVSFLIRAFLFTNYLPLNALETDIKCLKSIKLSLEDPFRNLASWYVEDICKFKGVECSLFQASYTVVGIELQGMGLKGKFPHGLENCQNLKSLNLSNNELHGSIPDDIQFIIPSIGSLDLSSNKFSGEIPSSLANFSYLQVLRLENNYLTGEIPKEFRSNDRIRITRECLEKNRGLCGWPLGSCEHHSPFRKGVAIGFSVSLLATVVAFSQCDLSSWMIFKTMDKMLMKRRKMKKQIDHWNTELPASADNLKQGDKPLLLGLEKMVVRFPYADLMNATNNFHERNILGMGSSGIVFKAIFPSGNYLAVKKLHYQKFLDEQFILELKTLGTLTHTNLLPLVGFCVNSKERLLVYKYMPNGRLYDWLNPEKSKSMDWEVRVKIAVGLARGLAWLHQGGHIRVIHLNVNSKSILLNNEFEPRLSNFGEAMLISPNSNSEFWEMAFMKEDVYSYGVVVLELMTGEDSSRYHSQSEWISCLLDRNSSTFHDLIDKSVVEQEIGDVVHRLIEIAFDCVQSVAEDRPTMQQVYQQITDFGQRYGPFDVSKLFRQNETLDVDHKGKSVETEISDDTSIVSSSHGVVDFDSLNLVGVKVLNLS